MLYLRRDFRIVNEHQRSVVKLELAAEPVATCTKLEFIGPDSFGVEKRRLTNGTALASTTLHRLPRGQAKPRSRTGRICPPQEVKDA